MSDPRDQLAALLGVMPRYLDQTGAEHVLTPETRDALLVAMGQPVDIAGARAALAVIDTPRRLPEWQVLDAGRPGQIANLGVWEIELEDGGRETGQGVALPALPLGIHRLKADGEVCWLLCAPARLPVPPLGWGVTLPLYGLDPTGRIGSYDDLAKAVRALGQAGADFVGINPVHAGFATDPQAISPYAPTHRGRLATIHLASDVAGSDDDLIRYERQIPAQQAALRTAFEACDVSDLDAWIAAEGAPLRLFTLHQALSDAFGPYWPDWPEAYHDPTGPAARQFADNNPDALRFHAWAQKQAEEALGRVQAEADATDMRFGLYLDLAVGTHPAGAETWAAPDLFARKVSLGAPPDAFSSQGQSWGIAPLRPDTLAAAGFRPLAAILRRQLGHARLLRIDHILGFERAFWVPEDGAIPGAYVQMPKDALLAVARIEAARVGATIVGEDLGNIPKGLQDDLRASGILGCRVAQFQQDWETEAPLFLPAAEYTVSALTSFGTHDLPTWDGWQAGRDIEWRRDLGDIDAPAHARLMAQRQAECDAFRLRIAGGSVIDMYRFLAQTPSRLIAVQIEDVLGKHEQPNLPGTIHEHPNWRRILGRAPHHLGTLDELSTIAKIMTDAGR